MNSLYSGRKEFKTIVNEETLRDIVKFTKSAVSFSRGYNVTSIYIAEWRGKKKHGRLRIRTYDNGSHFLEEKVKRGRRQTKKRYEIKPLERDMLMYAPIEYVREFCKKRNFNFSQEFFKSSNPISVRVNYDRTEFVIKVAGEEVRMTVDTNVKHDDVNLTPHKHIIEIKYIERSYICVMLREKFNLKQSNFGKYKLAVGGANV